MSKSQSNPATTPMPWSFIEDAIIRESVACDSKAVLQILIEAVDAMPKEPTVVHTFEDAQRRAFKYEALTAISALKKIQEIGNAKPSDIGF